MLVVAGCAGDGRSRQTATADTSPGTVTSAAGTSLTTAPTSTGASTRTSRAASTAAGTSLTTRAGTATTRSGGGITPSPTTRRRSSTTTRSTTTTTKPQVKPKLTVSISETGNADGRVQVNGGSTCASTCTYSFAKGTSITLDPIPIEAHNDWRSSSGQIACNAGNPCSFTINADLSVTAVFGDNPEEGS
jgi:hypothetical protein